MVWLMGFFMLAIAVPTAVVLQVQVRSTTMITTVVAPAYDANRQALQAMSDGETGLRGYQLSGGEPSLLQPYRTGEQRTGTALRRVRTLLERPRRAGPTARRSSPPRPPRRRPPQTGGPTPAGPWRTTPGSNPEVDRGKPLFDAFRAANATVGQRLQAATGRRARPRPSTT